MAQQMKTKMKEEFKKVQFMSATTDVWSRSNRSYIAVTVHYFDQNWQLQSKFLACERFTSNHTNDKVAEKLRGIFQNYGILEKVFFITTDGAGEYRAALKYHGDNYSSIQFLDHDLDFDVLLGTSADLEFETEIQDESDSDMEAASMVRNSYELHSMPYDVRNQNNSNSHNVRTDNEAFTVHELFNSEDSLKMLPNMNRISCSAHLLDKLGKNDALLANNDSDYDEMFKKVFTKLKAIWAIKESRLSAELFKRITGRQIIGPHRIRWSKTFEAVSKLLILCFFKNKFFILLQVEHLFKYDKEKLEIACCQLKIDPLDDADFDFLREYHTIIAPVAIALKTLESSQFSFGLYLPTLIGLRLKLAQLQESSLIYCRPLIQAIQTGFEKRFQEVLDVSDGDCRWIPLYIAMVTNPRYKLNYLGLRAIPSELSDKIRKVLFNAGKEIMQEQNQKSGSPENENCTVNNASIEIGTRLS